MAEAVIKGQSYSLLVPPDDSSALVKSQKEAIVGTVDIKKFVEHINNVGKFVQLAYNGVVGAGPAYADLQMKIYNLGCNITKIFDKSALTINSFQATAEEVSVTLQTTYQFLLDGFEDVAIDTLQSLEGTAKEMIKTANELKSKIDEQKNEAFQVIETTKKKKATLMEREWEKKEKEVLDQKMAAEELKEKLEEAKKAQKEYEKKRDDELAKDSYAGHKVAVGMLSMFFSRAGRIVKDMCDSESKEAKEKVEKYDEIAKKKAEIAEKIDELHKEALKKMKAYTQEVEKMKGCSEEEFADKAVMALYHAITALKCISVIMMQASHFWEGIENHCNTLAREGSRGIILRRCITSIKEKEKEDKEKFWQSKGFVTLAVTYHAQWIALRNVCTEYMPNIRETREELYMYIRENPTCKEARDKAVVLAAKLKGNLEKAIQEIDDQSKKSDDQVM